MVKKEGKIPANARVDIDYSKGKPKIKFSYTSKNPTRDAIRQNFYLIFVVIMLMFLPLFFIFSEGWETDYPKSCNGYFEADEAGRYIQGLKIFCDTGNYSLKYQNRDSLYGFMTHPKFDYDHSSESLESILSPIIYTIIAFLIGIVVTKYLVKKKWYKKRIPKFAAWFFLNLNGGISRYYKYYPKDIIENIIVIPRFSNVKLEYKTKGDFSKYLKKIVIREYRHKTINKKKKISKTKVNNYRWYAIFFFKEKPKNGYLEVITL